MSDWYCYKDQVKMEYSDEIEASYMEIDFTLEIGLRCPECGDAYVEESLATTKMAEGEEMIEEK